MSLEIRYDDQGRHEYFANTKNKFLTAELIRAKNEDQSLVKHWFGYGLLLCALGMMKASKERGGANTNDDTDTPNDDLAIVSAHCQGLARVIIPIIRTLYRGPAIATD